MPGKRCLFTTHVEAGSPPEHRLLRRKKPGDVVEAPGTAPGSVTIIPNTVYRHSRSLDECHIGLLKADRNHALGPHGRECRVAMPPGAAACRAPLKRNDFSGTTTPPLALENTIFL